MPWRSLDGHRLGKDLGAETNHYGPSALASIPSPSTSLMAAPHPRPRATAMILPSANATHILRLLATRSTPSSISCGSDGTAVGG